MDNHDFLAAAKELALQYPDDPDAVAFLEFCVGNDVDMDECLKIADRLVLKLIEIRS